MVPIRLPGGLTLQAFDSTEAEMMGAEVDRYFEPRFQLPSDATIVDAGANVGVFSGRAYERLGGAIRVHAFEPMPAVYAVLAQNLAPLGDVMRLHPFGLGRAEAEVEFAYFPQMPVLSSQFRGPEVLDAERTRIGDQVLQMIRDGELLGMLAPLPPELLEGMIRGQVQGALRPERVLARVRPLSAILEEQGLERVDLLKIDVEGAELEVLAGIEDRHWPRIQQITMECEQFTSRATEVQALLVDRGFTVWGEQRPFEVVGDCGLIFAMREE